VNVPKNLDKEGRIPGLQILKAKAPLAPSKADFLPSN